MQKEIELLKRQIPLLEYLKSRHWAGHPVGVGKEFVGLCPLHDETHPSFFVNVHKNLFFCHGCGQGGDLLRLVQLQLNLTFLDSVAYLKRELLAAQWTEEAILQEAVSFYRCRLDEYHEAFDYLDRRGVRDRQLIERLQIGYASGGCLRGHLANLGCTVDLLWRTGLVDRRGRDSFYRRVVIPLFDDGRVTNLYGRSIAGPPSHRFLCRSRGGLFAWNKVRLCRRIILVEGLFDVMVLWQAGFENTTCAFGIHLTREQLAQLCDCPHREVFIAFDNDANGSGQNAAWLLAHRLYSAGLSAHVVALPEGHDPNSYFVAGATAADFQGCLQEARPL